MDLRTQALLFGALIAFAIAIVVALRPRKRRIHKYFSLFAGTIAAWHLTALFARVWPEPFWQRLNGIGAVLLPVAGLRFFFTFVPKPTRFIEVLHRWSAVIAGLLIIVILTPWYSHPLVDVSVLAFVVLFLAASMVMILAAANMIASKFERARLRYLAWTGALAASFTLIDYLPYVGLELPPVGTLLTLVFLYILSQAILRDRLLDLYELAGKFAVLLALSGALASIFWFLSLLPREQFFLQAVVTALLVLLLLEPISSKVEDKISKIFFRERYALEQILSQLRTRLTHAIEIEDVVRYVLAGLEESRRVTHASIYVMDEQKLRYECIGYGGPEPLPRMELGHVRPLLDRLMRDDVVALENIEREIEERKDLGEEHEAETLAEVVQTLVALNATVCAAFRREDGVYGFLCVRDERLRDAFSPEEVQLLRHLAAQIAVALENSRLYQRMKERDRLVVLGEMAAGLAHEIRNPLGAIKASAQYLFESGSLKEREASSMDDFLNIIIEEVNRLNRVVSSFLDYARPARGDPTPTDINPVIERTIQLLQSEFSLHDVTCQLKLDAQLPAVRIDIEQLRQVIINLVQNAVQAMESGGQLWIETNPRALNVGIDSPTHWVELRITDTGPGLPQKILANLFVPFVTTKDRGTGLGLAISQRIVSAAGGHIEARNNPGGGSTFIVRLPCVVN